MSMSKIGRGLVWLRMLRRILNFLMVIWTMFLTMFFFFKQKTAYEIRSEEHTSELQSRSDLVCRLLLGSEEHTSELQSRSDLVCRLLLDKKRHCVCVHCVVGDRFMRAQSTTPCYTRYHAS